MNDSDVAPVSSAGLCRGNPSGPVPDPCQSRTGVPGRSVSELSRQATTSITPALGEHFYYAKLTQEDGNILCSAPVWVTRGVDGPHFRRRC